MSRNTGVSDALDTITTSDADQSAPSSKFSSVSTSESQLKVPDVEVQAVNEPGEPSEDFPAPTEEEKLTLRRVADTIPNVSFLLCWVELAERASYYATKTVFNNYMQFPLPEDGDGDGSIHPDRPNDHAGALNQGLRFATAMSLLFIFLGHTVPVFGAWIADTRLGRFKTIAIGVLVGLVAHVVMIGGAAPAVLVAGQGLAPFLISFFMLAIGAGIFKPNVMPLVVDQYTHQVEYVKTLPYSNERVIVDPEATVQRVVLIFYATINIGAFFAIPSTYIEKYEGFWFAFLVPTLIYLTLPVLLLVMRNRTVRKPPRGSELTQFYQITLMAVRQNRGRLWRPGFWDAALPSVLAAKGVAVPWTDKLVRDVARTYEACIIFLYFPLYQMNNGGIGAVASNQGAAMTSHGAPNDLLGNFNPIAIVVATPLLTYGVYPFLARRRIRFGRIRRMTFGFLMAAASGITGAAVQYLVYRTSPCGWAASTCREGVSPISIWWQLPNVVLGAVSEIFCNVTAYELAYARAPPNMKSLVLSMYLFTTALSSAAAQTIIPAVTDPWLVWVWAAPAIALVVQTMMFYWRHHSVDEDAFMIYEEDVGTVELVVRVDPGRKGEQSVSTS